MSHRQDCTALDAGGTVADHPVESLLELADDAPHPFLGEGVLVAGLRCREKPERLQPLVADERLRQLGNALDDVDEVEDDAAFGAHDQVEIAQADIEIDDGNHFTSLRQRRAERGGRGCLSDPALARRHDQDSCHYPLLH